MRRRLIPGLTGCIILALANPVLSTYGGAAAVRGTVALGLSSEAQQTRQRPTTQRTSRPTTSVSQELRRINGRLAALKSENDSLRARVVALERAIRNFTGVMPELRASLESTVRAKAAMDSSELTMVKQLSMIMNKIRLLEDKAGFIDSTNFEILSQLVLLENKIVSLTSSFNDIIAAREVESSPPSASMSDEEFRRQYVQALTTYQNGQYREAISRFTELVRAGLNHQLADNSQYWLAECYYAVKNYKQAIKEFEQVFRYTSSDKWDDARYKIALCYWNVGSHDRARIEFRKLLDEYPGSDLAGKARRYLQ